MSFFKYILTVLLSFSVVALFAQVERQADNSSVYGYDYTFSIGATASSFSGSAPDYTGGILTAGTSLLGLMPYSDLDSLQVGDIFFAANNGIYEIDSILSNSGSVASVNLRLLNDPLLLGVGLIPSGEGVVARPSSNGLVPVYVADGGAGGGLGFKIAALMDNFNKTTIDGQLGLGGSLPTVTGAEIGLDDNLIVGDSLHSVVDFLSDFNGFVEAVYSGQGSNFPVGTAVFFNGTTLGKAGNTDTTQAQAIVFSQVADTLVFCSNCPVSTDSTWNQGDYLYVTSNGVIDTVSTGSYVGYVQLDGKIWFEVGSGGSSSGGSSGVSSVNGDSGPTVIIDDSDIGLATAADYDGDTVDETTIAAALSALRTRTASEGLNLDGNTFKIGDTYMLNQPAEFTAARKMNWGNFVNYIGKDADSTQFVLDGVNGRFGVGVTPTYKLDVLGASGGTLFNFAGSGSSFFRGISNDATRFTLTDGSREMWWSSTFGWTFRSGAAYRFTINNSGSIATNSATANAQLDIRPPASTGFVRGYIRHTAASGTSVLSLGGVSSGKEFSLSYNEGNNYATLGTLTSKATNDDHLVIQPQSDQNATVFQDGKIGVDRNPTSLPTYSLETPELYISGLDESSSATRILKATPSGYVNYADQSDGLNFSRLNVISRGGDLLDVNTSDYTAIVGYNGSYTTHNTGINNSLDATDTVITKISIPGRYEVEWNAVAQVYGGTAGNSFEIGVYDDKQLIGTKRFTQVAVDSNYYYPLTGNGFTNLFADTLKLRFVAKSLDAAGELYFTDVEVRTERLQPNPDTIYSVLAMDEAPSGNRHSMTPNGWQNPAQLDTVYMVWRSGPDHNQTTSATGGLYFAKLDTLGGFLTTPVRVMNDSINGAIDWVANDGGVSIIGDTIWVTGMRRNTSISSHYRQQWLTYSTDWGATWVSPYEMTSPGTYYRYNGPSKIFQDGGNLYHVGYGKDLIGDTHYKLWLQESTDGGITWTEFAEIYDGASASIDVEEPQIQLLSNGNWHLTIRVDQDNILRTRTSATLAGLVGTPVNTGIEAKGSPAFFEASDTRLWMVTRASNNQPVINISDNFGSTWSQLKLLLSYDQVAGHSFVYGFPYECSSSDIRAIWAMETPSTSKPSQQGELLGQKLN